MKSSNSLFILLVLPVFLISSFSCNEIKDKNVEINKSFIKNLENANYYTLRNTDEGFNHIQSFTHDYQFAKNALPVLVKAKLTMLEAQKTFDSIENLKNDFQNQKNKLAKALSQIVQHYQSMLLQIDSGVHKENFMKLNSICFTENPFKYSEMISIFGLENESSYKYMLTKVQNDVRTLENYYVSEYGSCFRDCSNGYINKTHLLFSQNTSHLRKGEILKVEGFIGGSVKTAELSAELNNKFYQADSEGLFQYACKANGSPGKHILPITFHYKEPDGKSTSIAVEFEYTIDQ